jgi:hypothetical protein
MSNADPVLKRTWQHDTNQIITGATTQAGSTDDAQEYKKNLILAIKNSMIGFASNPWTVAGSASYNDNFGAMDAVDRWVAIDDIRWRDATNLQRSWIVLENAVLGIQFLFDCVCQNNRDGTQADAFITPIGTPFVGGSATARPTSAAEVQILNRNDTGSNGGWGGGDESSVSGYTYILSVQHSADGVATRVVIMRDANTCGFWLFDRIEEQTVAMTNPQVARIRSASYVGDDDSITLAMLHHNARTSGFRADGVGVGYYLAMPVSDGVNDEWSEEIIGFSPYDGRFSLAEVGVGSESAGHQGFWGLIYDLWWATAPGHTGRGWPSASRAQMQFGTLVFPWDGSVAITS